MKRCWEIKSCPFSGTDPADAKCPAYASQTACWEYDWLSFYRAMPDVLRRLKTWSHYILAADPNFEALLGQKADRRRKLSIGCKVSRPGPPITG